MCIHQKISLIFRTGDFRRGYISVERNIVMILNLATPEDVTETRHIIGLAFYYRNLLQMLVTFNPLKELTKKNTTFN